MSNFIVLLKQVPDVTKISDDCFNHETGVLLRNKLPSVINDLDTQALSLTEHMRRLQDGKGMVILLSMGPPAAEEVLRYGLKRGADEAILLTDKVFGGADTVATANPLSGSIRRVARDYFKDDPDYYVVCGMQSVDGDTAQVPPQVAEELGITCMTYVTKVEMVNGRFEFTRIVTGGNQVIAPLKLPAVLTVAKFEAPLFPSFSASRGSAKKPLKIFCKDDIDASFLGLDGSKTSVLKVFQPEKTHRKCIALHDPRELARMITESFRTLDDDSQNKDQNGGKKYVLPSKRTSVWDRSFESVPRDIESIKFFEGLLREMNLLVDRDLTAEEKDAILAKADKRLTKKQMEEMLVAVRAHGPSFPGEIWVMAERDQNGLHPATLELLNKVRDLADSLEERTGVLLLGNDNMEPLVKELIAGGADKVYTIINPVLDHFDPIPWRKAVVSAVLRFKPGVLLFSATAQGRTLAPMISYRTGNGLTADCTGIDIRDFTLRQKTALMFQTRPALGGNIMATIITKNSSTQMATARPGVFKRVEPDMSRTGEIIKVQAEISESDLSWQILRSELPGKTANFHAQVIVSGGKGVRSKPNYNELTDGLITSLASKLGTQVERGGSRAAVEHGFVERAYQVGQTGTSVSPKIYLALGISGAIQHMVGIANTRTIFAVNNDPSAPIFKQCDYYLVGDVDEVVPELVKALKE